MFAVIDIEATGLNRFKDDITFIGVGLAKSVEENIFKYLYYDFSNDEDIERFIRLLGKLKRRKVKTIFQNGKFDTLFIEEKIHNGKFDDLIAEENIGGLIPITHDIMLMGTAYDLADRHGLKYMAEVHLGVPDWDIKKKDKMSKDFKVVKPYLKKDVKYTWKLFQFFMEVLTEEQMKIYKKLLKPAYLMYRDVERRGIYFDKKAYREVKAKYQEEEKEKLKALNKRYKINWNSPQQKQKVLFEDEGLPVISKSPKTGNPSAGADVLNRLAYQGYELPKLMLEYSKVNTANKMFLKRWGDDVAPDGRIHPSFNLTNVVSGRTSCTDPNLQQVPREKAIRSLFHANPKEGRIFFEADYSQLELRIAAHYSNDPTMLRIYREDGDIHTETAKLLTNGKEPTKEERNKAKAVNFGFLYGMFAKGFVDYAFDNYGVIFTLPEAEAFRRAFFAKYDRLPEWHEEQKRKARNDGGVYNLFGRFRRLDDIYSDNWGKRGSAERISINTPVQGTGSDILLSAGIEIHRELRPEGLNIVGTVHDSILGEFYEKDADWIVPEIKRIMSHPKLLDEFGVKLKVKLDCDVGVGKWGTH